MKCLVSLADLSLDFHTSRLPTNHANARIDHQLSPFALEIVDQPVDHFPVSIMGARKLSASDALIGFAQPKYAHKFRISGIESLHVAHSESLLETRQVGS